MILYQLLSELSNRIFFFFKFPLPHITCRSKLTVKCLKVNNFGMNGKASSDTRTVHVKYDSPISSGSKVFIKLEVIGTDRQTDGGTNK